MKLFIVTLLFLPIKLFSQLGIGGDDPVILVNQVMAGTATSISNIQYSGSLQAIAYFQANVENMPFTSGVVMTTGSKWNAQGPNNNAAATAIIGASGSWYINDLLSSNGVLSNDASTLMFDLIPDGNTINVNYIFGSEEYPEFVGSIYNDAFAIYISGPGIVGYTNIALSPSFTSISMNTINNGLTNLGPCVNCWVYTQNGTGINNPYNLSDTFLQYDGLTRPMKATSSVIPGETYHLIFVIADVGDQALDSGVFIEAGSLTASTPLNELDDLVTISPNPLTSEMIIELTDGNDFETYEIYDLAGKLVRNGKLEKLTHLNVADLHAGMYHVQLISKSGTVSKKVVKY